MSFLSVSHEKFKKGFQMKNYIVLLCLSISLHAVPSYIEKELCSQLAYDDIYCGEGSEIAVYQELLLEDKRKLKVLFLNSNDIEKMEFLSNAPKAYVMVDKVGKWHLVKNSGVKWGFIYNVMEDFKGQIWVKASFGMESPSPFLLYSKNGESFSDVALPFEKGTAPYEYEIKSLCFEKNHLELGLGNKLWRVDYASILNKNPQWKSASSASKKCIKPKHNSNEQEKRFVDMQKENHYFSIQIGAFKKIENLNIVEKKFKKLEGDFSFHTVRDKEYVRLLLRYLSTKKKAQVVLKKLKKKYPHNKYIQEALVKRIESIE